MLKLHHAIITIIGLSLFSQNTCAQNYLSQEAELRIAFAQAKNGISWLGAESLYNADINIVLGAGALRNEINYYPNKAYQAIGAYNAGPTAVNRWQSQRPNLDPDFWIEPVTYKETREYIARVLAFSVIYDWRLKQSIVSLSNRMAGDFSVAGKNKFSCPSTKTQ